MRLIDTSTMKPQDLGSDTSRLHVYCALDCMLTAEVFEAIQPQLDNQTNATYQFSLDLMGVCLEMSMRGVRVDEEARQSAIAAYKTDLTHITNQLHTLLADGLDLELNWRSPAQLKKLFYEVMKFPPIKKRNAKGESSVTVDRDALEKLSASYFMATPLVSHILGSRDIAKNISTLETEIDLDGRIRTSYNIGGTTSGRLSSSLSDFGTGGNLQNVSSRLRQIFIPDEGKKFAYIDLEQAESRAVGAIIWNLFHDGAYLDACEGGDLHSQVCRLAFPDFAWTDDPKKNREIASNTNFYRALSYRDGAKKLGHSTNYAGTPHSLEAKNKIPSKIIKEFQHKYFAAFPKIPLWHQNVAQTLKDEGKLTTLTGRRRHFFGRRTDPDTIREAISYDPQGSVADILNRGMLAVWRSGLCDLLLQVHDAILIQYPEELEHEILPQVLKLIEVPIELRHGRTLLIPSEAKSGFNWADYHPDTNPRGLRKYVGAKA